MPEGLVSRTNIPSAVEYLSQFFARASMFTFLGASESGNITVRFALWLAARSLLTGLLCYRKSRFSVRTF